MPKNTGFHIIQYPSKILRQVSEEVEFDSQAVSLANKLQMILPATNGFAVAAPQIGISKRAFSYNSGKIRGAIFNPQIVDFSEELWMYPEGCLSFPGKYWNIERPRSIKVVGYSSRGDEKVLELTDLEARIFQHEVDHLDGVLVIDHLVKNELQ